jgi:hypothetical protein
MLKCKKRGNYFYYWRLEFTLGDLKPNLTTREGRTIPPRPRKRPVQATRCSASGDDGRIQFG